MNKTTIDWCDELPVGIDMALRTKNLYIKPVALGIAKMMMIKNSWFATEETWQVFGCDQPSSCDRAINRISNLLPDLWRWGKQSSCTSCADMTTEKTRGSESISARVVNSKHINGFPLFALGTSLEPRGHLDQIIINCHSETFGCNFCHSQF